MKMIHGYCQFSDHSNTPRGDRLIAATANHQELRFMTTTMTDHDSRNGDHFPFPRGRTTLLRLRRFGQLAAAFALLLLFLAPACAATFRFASTSNRIYVEGGGSATLSDIKVALPNAPLDLVDAANRVWLLRANLFITDGSIMVFHGTAIGGDVNEFRLLSSNSSSNFVSVTADWGMINVQGTKITSWDSAANGPDTEFQTFGRAFVRVRSRLDVDGVTPHESRMDILDSEIQFLGYDAAESYGLVWKVNGTAPDPSKSIFNLVNVFGDIKNSHIHDNYFGTYTFGAYGCQWLNNEVDHNAGYGFDPHDDSDNLVIEGNDVHHNGMFGRGHHGIIASRRCDHIVIRNNRSWANAGNGIMLHRHCDDGLIENNQTFENGDSGIALFDTDGTTIRNNLVISNFNAGMRFSVGASDNVVDHNEVGYSGKYGFYLYAGDDPAEADDTDPTVSARPRRNSFSNNLVHHSIGQPINLGDADDTTFVGNTFSPGPGTLGFENATSSVLNGNSFPANVMVILDGAPTNSTTMTLKNQPQVQLQIDSYSLATFEDDAGAIFDLDQGDLGTTADTSGSFLSVTLAGLGAETAIVTTTVVTRNFLVVPDSGAVLINPTLWELSGGLRKQWTTQPVNDGTSATVVSATSFIHYTVGDLSPNTSYMVSKDARPLSAVMSDSTGRVSFADVPGTTSPVPYAIVVNDQPAIPTVTVAATDANASETGPDTGTFTISRTGATTAGLTVHYSLAGTAANGPDYATLSGSLTIPAGAASAAVTVTPIDDTAVESNETVILTLSADAAYTVGSPNSATVTIADNDQAPPPIPMVTVAATDANASEAGPDTGTFTISRSGATTAGLTVHYSLGGSAANGTDYASLSGSLTILAGAASAAVTVTPINDTAVEGIETAILTVSADAAYTVGSPNSATVTIAENQQGPPLGPVVTVVAADANASETGPDSGTFTIGRTGDTATALNVHYTLAGTAVNGTDYASVSGFLTIPAGAASSVVTATPIHDTAVEGNETVILTLSADAAYTVGSPNSATVTIAENEQGPPLGAIVTVAATDADASETGPDAGTFTITRTGSTASGLTVHYSTDGKAVNGTDYAPLSGSVIIPAGAASATVTLTPIVDSGKEGNETAILTLSLDAAYTVGKPDRATVKIDHSKKPSVDVKAEATDAKASEKGHKPGRFTISRRGGHESALTVTYSLGGTAVNGVDYELLSGSVTIPAGANSASVIVQPIEDTQVEGDETVVLILSADAAYAATVRPSDRATVTIEDDRSPSPKPKTVVSMTATDILASEPGTDTATVTISRTGGSAAPLTVNYTIAGTAVNGVDFQSLPGAATIPAGASSVDVLVRPLDDSLIEVAEMVILTLSPSDSYGVGVFNTVVITILDNDLLPLGLGPTLNAP